PELMRIPRRDQNSGQDLLARLTIDVMPRKNLIRKMSTHRTAKHHCIIARCHVSHSVKVVVERFSKRFVPSVVEQVDIVPACGRRWQFSERMDHQPHQTPRAMYSLRKL